MSFVIGLTGHTGAGKTTACKVFAENGFLIVDCDKLAHNVLDNDCKDELVSAFSSDILTDDKKIDRPKLAQIVFSNKDKLDILNHISHRAITKRIKDIIADNQNRIIVLDAPTLFEANADTLCNVIVAISARDDILLSRIMKRDGITLEKAKMRLSNQKSRDFFIKNCDYFIENNETEQALCDKISLLIPNLKNKAKLYIKEE